MDVLIHGVNFKNKGAELMMYSILERVQKWNTKNKVTIDFETGTFEQRNEAGIHHYLWKWFWTIPYPYGVDIFNLFVSAVPPFVRDRYNLILESDINCVMDASGFAYSDQWGEEKTDITLKLCQRWKKQGKKVIFLPQAFGSFNNAQIRDDFSQIIEIADLIFARDQQSYDYINQIANSMDNIKLAPDFTNLLKGLKPNYGDKLIGRPCIIPNYRMIDKTTAETKNQYLTFINSCVQFLLDRELNPFILIHEVNDLALGKQIQENFAGNVELIQENNPLYLKGILGGCQLAISSRFHGLISALAQGVPCLGTGWSHKYQKLFESYSCPEMLVDLQNDLDQNLQKLDLIVSEPSRTNLIQSIQTASQEQKTLSEAMWQEIEQLLFN